MVDNAADESVCPPWFAPWVKTVGCENPKLYTADQTALEHYGKKVVTVACGGVPLDIGFKVANVHCPILSVGRFTEKHKNRTAWFSDTASALYLDDGTGLSLRRSNRHWMLDVVARVVDDSLKTGPESKNDEIMAAAAPEGPVVRCPRAWRDQEEDRCEDCGGDALFRKRCVGRGEI